MIVACATDDNINLTKDHFGDATNFNIYNVGKEIYELVDNVRNNTTSEFHADVNKAKQILELFKNKGVHILMNRSFGPNIKVVNRYVSPVVSRETNIFKAIGHIQNSFNEIDEVINNKKDCYLSINNEGIVKVIETT